MPEGTAIVTALILDRPLCLRCLTAKSSLRYEVVLKMLECIEIVLALHRRAARCTNCGDIGPAVFIARPADVD